MGTKINLNSDILNESYQPDLELRQYSFFDMAKELERFTADLASTEEDTLSRYLLFLRKDYLIREVCAKPSSDYTKALIGIFSISPLIVRDVVSPKGVNIFLARDAARDFVTAKIMNETGLYQNKSYILYFSRKNLRTVYKAIKRITSDAQAQHYGEQTLYKRMVEEFVVDSSFRDEAIHAYGMLSRSGVLDYTDVKFIDTWASGTIFVALDFVIRLFDEYVYEGKKLVKKTSRLTHNVSFAVANNKNRVMVVETIYDYMNVESEFSAWWKLPKAFYNHYKYGRSLLPAVHSFNCNDVTTQQIQDWYRYYGVSFPYDIQPNDFCELVTAQIYKGLNHFGSLNLGHPVEWDDDTKQLVVSSNAKKMGNLMRNMFLINAVVGYQHNYVELIKQKKIPHTTTNLRPSLLMRKFGLSKFKASMLDKVLYDNCEHVVTCHFSITENLIRNVIVTMDFFGHKAIAEMSRVGNYNFQYYLNGIKSVPTQTYKENLNILSSVYLKKKMIRTMLLQNAYHFVKEVLKAKQMKRNLDRKIETIVFDIDGTLTPIEKGIELVGRCIKNKINVVFITGRPRSFCEHLADDLYRKLPIQYKSVVNSVLFYCSNGSEAFSAAGVIYKKRKSIPINVKKKLYALFNDLDLGISSERDYRVIATYKGKDNNANRLLAYSDKIKEEFGDVGFGVYLIKWDVKSFDKTMLFNSVDVCSSSKKDALAHLLQSTKVKNYIVIGDDPDNSDRETIGENDISVEGYGLSKTRSVINYLLAHKKGKMS